MWCWVGVDRRCRRNCFVVVSTGEEVVMCVQSTASTWRWVGKDNREEGLLPCVGLSLPAVHLPCRLFAFPAAARPPFPIRQEVPAA